jgi:hypothetical protein
MFKIFPIFTSVTLRKEAGEGKKWKRDARLWAGIRYNMDRRGKE